MQSAYKETERSLLHSAFVFYSKGCTLFVSILAPLSQLLWEDTISPKIWEVKPDFQAFSFAINNIWESDMICDMHSMEPVSAV